MGKPQPPTEGKTRLSYSKLSTFMSCRRKYYWIYDQNLSSLGRADYLQVGIAVHDLRERWVKGELKIEDITGLKQVVQDLYPENDPQTTSKVALESATLFNGYVQDFSEDQYKLVSPEMTLEWDSGEFILYTRLDGLAIDQANNYYLDELKTTARMDSYYLQGLRKGLQAGIRYWIAEEVLDFDTKGTLYEIIVKTKIPQYQRMPVMKDRWTVDYTKETVYGLWESIKRCGRDKSKFYPSMNCSQYRECEYETLCRQDTPIKRANFFKEYYPTTTATKEVPRGETK